jgi:hypothetical protein
MADTYLGRFGALNAVRCFAKPLPAPVGRASSRVQLLDGSVRVHRAIRPARSWEATILRATPAEARFLIRAESGSIGAVAEPLYWYDGFAAKVNMFHPNVADPGMWADEPLVSSNGAATVITYNMPFGLWHQANVTGTGEAWCPIVPVRPSVAYVAIARVAGSESARLRLAWVDSAGAVISTVDGSAGTDPRTATGTSPANAAGVRVALDPTSTTTETGFFALQLIEGTTLASADWNPGEGIPQVVISGLERTHQAVWPNGTIRSDYTAVLVEVG